MLSFPSDFYKIDAIFLKFIKDLNNPAGGSSSVSENSGKSKVR